MEFALIVAGIVALLVIVGVAQLKKKQPVQHVPPVSPPTPVDPRERGMALFGDSLTAALGLLPGYQNVPAVENHAIAGTSSTDAVQRFDILHKIANTPMDTVVIRYGVVDAMRGEQNILQYNLLNMAAAAGKRRVIFVGGINVPLNHPPEFQRNYLQVDEIIKMVAAATGREYLGLRHIPMGNVPDLLHPDGPYSELHAAAIASVYA